MSEIIAIVLLALACLALGYFWGRAKARRREIPQALKQSRAIIKGQFSEQIAPLLPGFPEDLKLSEARFLGKPVDFLFFKGLDEQNITEVVFLEVKTGQSSLNVTERRLRDAIKEKRVVWREYRVQESATEVIRLPLPSPPAKQ